jgi:TRAP-type C4-dicarboxylate transport system permease small subunit
MSGDRAALGSGSVQAATMALADRLQRMQLRLAAAAMMVMMLVIVSDVVLRYAFNRPIRFSYDLVECTLVVFVFHGLAAVFFRRQNIVIDLIDSALGRAAVAVLIRLSDVVSIFVLLVFLLAMIQPAMQAFAYGDRKLELGLPVYMIWIVAITGIAGTALCALAVSVFGAIARRDGTAS